MGMIIGLMLAWKVASALDLTVQLVRLPVMAASAIANWRLAGAMKANTAAMLEQTAVTEEATVAQGELDVAMDANPIGLIILAIMALIAIIIVLIKYHKQIGEFFVKVWHDIQAAFHWAVLEIEKGIVWIISKFRDLQSALSVSNIWNGFVGGFKWAINQVIGLLNGFIGRFDSGVIGTLNSLAGFFGIPHIPSIPYIPYLAKGGTAIAAGLAIVGENGPELLHMPRGATVTPLSGGSGGPAQVHLHFGAVGGGKLERAFLEWIRDQVKSIGGGGFDSVQKAFGS
jgi:hypothetical protein